MIVSKSIALIGMPGAGKTSVGKLLALKLGLDFHDLDATIEAKESVTVAEIIRHEGEVQFRKLEREVLEGYLLFEPIVLSVGGGTPCYHNSIEILNRHFITVWLRVHPEIIAERLTAEASQRPLLGKVGSKEDLIQKLEQLESQRFSCYEQCQLHVNAGLDPISVADEIMRAIRGI